MVQYGMVWYILSVEYGRCERAEDKAWVDRNSDPTHLLLRKGNQLSHVPRFLILHFPMNIFTLAHFTLEYFLAPKELL